LDVTKYEKTELNMVLIFFIFDFAIYPIRHSPCLTH